MGSEAFVPPAMGDGLTMFRRGGALPGTVVRVSTSGRCAWFTLDPPPGATLPAGAQPWVYRAYLQDDGVWRDDYTKERVELGVRRPYVPESNPEAVEGKRTLVQLDDAVERIEPWLLRTRWPPMTGMLIPSVLKSADALIGELSARTGGELCERSRILALRQRMERLRQGFRPTRHA